MRLKDYGCMYSGLTGKSGDDFRCEDLSVTKPYIPFTNILNNFVIDPKQFKQVVMEEGEQQNKVADGDLLFLMSSEDYESIGKSAVVCGDPGEVYLNSFCRGFRFRYLKRVNPQFVNYQLSADVYRDNLRFEARGFTRINLKIDRVESAKIDLPSLPDQNRIVAYLDEKTAAIDKQVSLLELKKEKYAMLKKSVIKQAVCGEGKDWTNHRFKYFASTIKGKSMDYFDDPIDGSKLVLTVETLRMDNPTFSNYGLSYDREQECHEGDIVIIWDGAGVGEFLHAKEGVLSSTVAKIDLNEKKMLKRYFWYWGGQIEYELKSMPTGMGIPHLDPHILNNYKIPLPPLSEQKAIADYLDEKCAKIDATIANIDQQIEKYKLLRRALINEVVTGQRAV